MLAITDLQEETKIATGITEVTRSRKVNGERTISFGAIPNKKNQHAWPAINNESKVDFLNDKYIIKNLERGSKGQTETKSAEAVQTFFNTMINSHQYNVHSGSQTFQAALNRVFGPTIYSFVIVGSFSSQSFENFGKENCLALFKKVLERYGAEFRVSGNIVYLYEKIGAHTGFQWRYKLNIKDLKESTNTNPLTTVIRGYFGTPNDAGVYPIELEHRSNVEKFGELHADPVYDERVNDLATAKRFLEDALISEPQLSQTIDFADLQAAGYDQGRPNEGDWGFIIYEPMNIIVEARIVEITEVFRLINKKWVPVKTNVTLSNIKSKLSDVNTRFAKTTKQLDRITSGLEKLPIAAMDNAILNMTRLMENASTELLFTESDGIHAVSKLDSNRRVMFNSEGVFFSRDGGNTPYAGFTADGIVAEAIYGYSIFGVNISSDNGDSTMWIEGGDLRLTDSRDGQYLNFNPRGMTGFNEAGEILFQANKTWVTSSILGTNTTNVYLAAEGTGEARIVDIKGIPGDGLIDSYNYLPIRTSGIFGNFWNINPASGNNAQNLYARPLSDGEVRITANSTTDLYRDLRARSVYANMIENNGLFGESIHTYIKPRSGGEVRATVAGSIDNHVPVRASGYYGDFVDTTATHLYLRPAGDPGEVRVTVRGTLDVYQPIRAKDFITDTSVRENKKNIEIFEEDTLHILRSGNAYLYNRNTDKEGARKQLGMMIKELPEVTHSDYGDSFALYALAGFQFKVSKDLLTELDKLKSRVSELESAS